MMRDNLHLQIVLGLRVVPDDQEIRERAGVAVDLFLLGIASGRIYRKDPTDRSPPLSNAPTRKITRRTKPA
jgi:hypothetical protein